MWSSHCEYVQAADHWQGASIMLPVGQLTTRVLSWTRVQRDLRIAVRRWFFLLFFYQGSAGGGWTKWMEPNWCIHSCSANSLCFSRQCTGEVQCIWVWLAGLVSSCREIRPSNLTSVIHFGARLLIYCLLTPTWADLFQSGLSHCEELCLQGQFVTRVNIKSRL